MNFTSIFDAMAANRAAGGAGKQNRKRSSPSNKEEVGDGETDDSAKRQRSSPCHAPCKDGPREGDTVLLMRREWLDKILDGTKTMETRSRSAKPQELFFGMGEFVFGRATLTECVRIQVRDEQTPRFSLRVGFLAGGGSGIRPPLHHGCRSSTSQ